MDDFELPGPIAPRKAPERPTSSDRYIDALLVARYEGTSPSEAVLLMQGNGYAPKRRKGRPLIPGTGFVDQRNWFRRALDI